MRMMIMSRKNSTPVASAKSETSAKTLTKSKAKLTKVFITMAIFVITTFNTAMTVLAAPAGGGYSGGGTGATADPSAAFNDLIKFFATWFGRLGLVVGFIGAIMFALAIRNEDADAKSRGLMTMISGFVVFAVTLSLSLFGIV